MFPNTDGYSFIPLMYPVLTSHLKMRIAMKTHLKMRIAMKPANLQSDQVSK
jgi:hypothetical protein